MIPSIIIDDELNAIEVMSMQLEKYCPQIQVLRKCQGGVEGIKAIKELSPKLVFLDIEMPKVNGFDVLNATLDGRYKVIFTTAYDEFALKAFKYSAIDYLLKPIDIEELKASVKKVVDSSTYDLESKMATLINYFNEKKTDKIALPNGEGYDMVPYSNIIRCESDSNYTVIHLTDKRKITVSKTLKDVEESLPYPTFFRIHNSHVINLNHIAKFYKSDGGYVVLDDGTNISLGRSKKDEFL
ncbi:MAG: hypothetical protein RLZZ546_198, partial [Bacteroidota bacterium]